MYADVKAMNANAAQFANAIQSTIPKQPSVNDRADNALESASRTHAFAEQLHDDLRQMIGSKDTGAQPCRSGIDGKLLDASEHSDATLNILRELRLYLLG